MPGWNQTWNPTRKKVNEQYENMGSRTKMRVAPEMQARSVGYKSGRIVIELKNGSTVMIPVDLIQGLNRARVKDIRNVKIGPRGATLHWRTLDTDCSVTGLLNGAFANQAWMAEIGRRGGRSTSEAKRAASRLNGAKGGRPRKRPGA